MDDLHALLAVVEAGKRREALAAVHLEHVSIIDCDLLERLQTIGGEPGGDHRDAPHATPRQARNRLNGCGRKPFAAAEARMTSCSNARPASPARVACASASI